ncbi:hypothetical protein AG1IA_06650 [Rhizoctonia solani AG-1 IA]|uniref:Uncharacterized protein n=1 Tax=Thanatephorus cucumeris (strain AG1-IA) TaxID=983506 RepID=L8WN04_THACA|nr:hypothetical protein AG1IA_06650 [Rhizoctonia solani AG-1 IA]
MIVRYEVNEWIRSLSGAVVMFYLVPDATGGSPKRRRSSAPSEICIFERMRSSRWRLLSCRAKKWHEDWSRLNASKNECPNEYRGVIVPHRKAQTHCRHLREFGRIGSL